MNQQTPDSGFTNNSSASSSLSPLVPPDKSPQPKETASADAPLPRAVTQKSKSPATVNTRKASPAKSEDRCRHYTATGRRCRLAVLDPASGLCFRHVALQFQPTDEDLSPAFAGLLSGFQSASRIHGFLTQLTVLLVQNRISTRRAAILAYLGQTLLRTLPAINDELTPSAPDTATQILLDLPRPKRDDDISPEHAMVNRWAERCARSATPVAPDGYDGYTSNPDKSK